MSSPLPLKPRRASTIVIDGGTTEPSYGSPMAGLRTQAKVAADTFLAAMISELESQREGLRKKRKSIQTALTKGQAGNIKDMIMMHNWHLIKLSAIRTSLEQDEVSIEAVWKIEQAVRDYVAYGLQNDSVVAKGEEIYSGLPKLEEKERNEEKDDRAASIFTLPSGRSMGSQISVKSTSLTTEALWAIDDSLKAWIQSIDAHCPRKKSPMFKLFYKAFRKRSTTRRSGSGPSFECPPGTDLEELVKILDKMRTTVVSQNEFESHGKGTSKQELRELLILQDDIKRMVRLKENWVLELDPSAIYAIEKRLDEWVERWKSDVSLI
ncbi:hypothetical protein GGR53DRAFT_465672 [Hypoxylon sp. FL1150]|nr:hypothetical protein GGR53DRAFT_465672 [Hypoxylon sp. FL1150]